jgi:hypothetical protein
MATIGNSVRCVGALDTRDSLKKEGREAVRRSIWICIEAIESALLLAPANKQPCICVITMQSHDGSTSLRLNWIAIPELPQILITASDRSVTSAENAE